MGIGEGMSDGPVLITGGTGFIGSRLALALAAAGHRVRVLALENTDAERSNRALLEKEGIDVALGSVTDPVSVGAAVRGVTVVYHLAAAQHEMNVPDEHFEKVNVTGTANVVEASTAAGVTRLVFGGTIGVYGDPREPVDETSPTQPVNAYGVTKLRAERVVLAARDDLHVTVVRIPEVYGPGDRRLLKLFRLIAKNRFFLIGNGRNLHHPIYIDDLVRAFGTIAIAPYASGETFVLCGCDVVETREMVAAVARALGREPPRLRLPMWPFAGAALILETVLRPLGVQPPIHRRRLDFFRKSFSLSARRASRILDFEPRVRFQEGARLTARWYAGHGLLDADIPAAKPESNSPTRAVSDA